MKGLSRLINPKSIALYGGGWSSNVLDQLLKSGFGGDIWPVHPKKTELMGLPCFKDTAHLPGIPDAAFLGVNRNLSVSVVKELSDIGAGGAICFASGFAEMSTGELQDALVAAAGDMPILGPNCYGLLNLDIAQLFTIGNQAVIGIADLGLQMLGDERITAIGLYLEGFNDIRALEKFARKSRQKNIPVVILKTGKTQKSRSAAISHTASLSGSDKDLY